MFKRPILERKLLSELSLTTGIILMKKYVIKVIEGCNLACAILLVTVSFVRKVMRVSVMEIIPIARAKLVSRM